MTNSSDAEADMIEIIDLTKVLDKNLSIYTNGPYSDPALEIETWCTIQKQGYKVSRLSMGTQTGTHIDAPAHFAVDGATLEALPLQAMIGQYIWIDLGRVRQSKPSEPTFSYKGEALLFLTSSGQNRSEITEEILLALLKLPCRVWVIAHGFQVRGREPYYFHQALAAAGKYLIEDVDEMTAMRVKAGGELIALPLRLSGVSGAPCRVIVRQSVRQEEFAGE